MSHWTRANTVIKDLRLLKKAAVRLGVEVIEGENLKLESVYEKAQDAVMLFKYNGGVAGVIKNDKEGYSMSMDNFYNPICEKVGADCSLLGREYSKMLVEHQALMMGGVITQSTVMDNGSVEMIINVY